MSFREAVAENYRKEYGIEITADNVVAGPGAKPFEQFFCEAFLDPGDEVLCFSPQFPTYLPNIQRRSALLEAHDGAACSPADNSKLHSVPEAICWPCQRALPIWLPARPACSRVPN